MWSVIGAILVGCAVAAVSPVALRPLLFRMGAVDVPSDRSSHTRPTARGYGLAQLAGVVVGGVGVSLALANTPDSRAIIAVVAVGAIAGVVGATDDMRAPMGLSVWVRLIVQAIIGVGLALAAMWLTTRPWWIVPVGAVFVAGYINVANFMDGINGISGLHGLVVGICYAVVGSWTGLTWLMLLGLLIAAVFVVFLPWNLSKAGGFLGDVGSYLLGGMIGGTAVLAICSGVPALAVVGPLAIYLGDTILTASRRLFIGESVIRAHRTHAYQRLVSLGAGHFRTALLVASFSAATGILGLLAIWYPTWVVSMTAGTGMLMLCIGYWLLPLWGSRLRSYRLTGRPLQ